VSAQHMLGLAYHEGVLTKANSTVALAWLRESVRNGNPVSYLNCGDILHEQKNKLFALINYLGAYQHGALFLKEKIMTVV
jgi:hypothetical protein